MTTCVCSNRTPCIAPPAAGSAHRSRSGSSCAGFAALVAALVWACAATAEPGSGVRPISLELSCIECGLGEAEIRSAVLAETGLSVVVPDQGVPRLRLTVRGRVLHAVYEPVGRPPLERRMTLPEEPERATQAIALLATNLVRDQAAELIDALHPPPVLGASESTAEPPSSAAAADATARGSAAQTAAQGPSPAPIRRADDGVRAQPSARPGNPAADSSDRGSRWALQALAWTSTGWPANGGVRGRYDHIYALFGVGWKAAEVDRVAWQVGVGGHLPVGAFFADIDAGYAHEGEAEQGHGIEHTHVFRYRAILGWQPASVIGLFAGAGIRHEFPRSGSAVTQPEALVGIQLF